MLSFRMVLNPKDANHIRILKNVYGYTQTSELIRFLVNNKIEELIKERRKNQLERSSP